MRGFGIRPRTGRHFTEYDQKSANRVIIVNETLASKYWPGEDPVGKRLKLGPADSDFPWLTVVGVVGDVKDGPMDAAADPHAYEPMMQVPYALRSLGPGVRAKGDPATLTAAVPGRIARADPELAVGDLRTMEQLAGESAAPRRFLMQLLALFAATAVLLAAIGIYGVLARTATERTHEIGIRVALGAQNAEVYGMILSQGPKLALLGVLIGLPGSLALTRALATNSTEPARRTCSRSPRRRFWWGSPRWFRALFRPCGRRGWTPWRYCVTSRWSAAPAPLRQTESRS